MGCTASYLAEGQWLVFHAFLSDRCYAWESARPVNVRMVGLEFLCKPLNYFLKTSLTDSSNEEILKVYLALTCRMGKIQLKLCNDIYSMYVLYIPSA